MSLYPLTFHPIFKERVWGGRGLEKLYHKQLPAGVPIGESWEISDRPGDISVIANGPLAGKDLHWLVQNHWKDLAGSSARSVSRFPLLIKILDARQKLSLQVHPPAEKAAELGGEPKTEMWFITDAAPGAELYVGLKKGVNRQLFERKITSGTVAECFHRVPVRSGDAMFLPSGRVHAIGSGLVIFEIQQNSDTTYRVYDWGRVGLNGEARELHIPQSLASIDFKDFEPELAAANFQEDSAGRVRHLVKDSLFAVELRQLEPKAQQVLDLNTLQILGVVTGKLRLETKGYQLLLVPGQFCLIPAALETVSLTADSLVAFLRINPFC